MAEENKKIVEDINLGSIDAKNSKFPKKEGKAANIFDDFNTDTSLEAEVTKLKKEQDKDIFFYLHLLGKVFQFGFALLIVAILFIGIYLFIQKNENISSQSFLNPICGLFNGDVPSPDSNCASVSYTKKHYNKLLDELKAQQTEKILGILPKVYEYENATKTKEISFLLDKSNNNLNILKVLESFFDLKNSFNSTERQKIQCANYSINADTRVLSMSCSAKSQGFEKNSIMGFGGQESDEKVGGTSVSVANSFLNFIEKQSRDLENNRGLKFILIDRQKIFHTESILDAGYTNKTNFDVKLKINF